MAEILSCFGGEASEVPMHGLGFAWFAGTTQGCVSFLISLPRCGTRGFEYVVWSSV